MPLLRRYCSPPLMPSLIRFRAMMPDAAAALDAAVLPPLLPLSFTLMLLRFAADTRHATLMLCRFRYFDF